MLVDNNAHIIFIGKLRIEQNNDLGTSRLVSDIMMDGKYVYTVWYEVDRSFEEYLCTERVDGLVVNLLLYAMEHGYDIKSENKISEQLYYQLTEYLIPSISGNINKYNAINIDIPLSSQRLLSMEAVGASLSGGVDSFYTLDRHLKRKEAGFNITHLCFFNAGASGAGGGEKARERYKKRIEWIRDVSVELEKSLVCVDTNINEFLHQEHQATHTFRTLSIPLILQKLFSKYYFASGEELKYFCFSEVDTAAYDLLITKCISTENLIFFVSGGEVSRMQKVEAISENKIASSKLNVCVAEDINCGKCDKCRRTMVELYALGKLDNFSGVFDVDYFYNHKRGYFARMLAFRKSKTEFGGYDWADVYDRLKPEITVADRFYGMLYKIYRITRRKIYRIGLAKRIYETYLKRKEQL